MNYLKITFSLFIFSLMISCSTYQKDLNGVTVKIKNPGIDGVKTIRIEVIDKDIIHVQTSAVSGIPATKSLMVDPDLKKQNVDWKITEKDKLLILSTSKVKVEINTINGKVNFLDAENNVILSESQDVDATLKPYEMEGQTYYKLQEVFDSPDDEAFYGLGQHQNGEVNYKGKDVDLLQHNIVAVVPFLVSNRNYGILWDNYSHTKFGDPRAYQQLSILNLYDENGRKGGLTARYYADRNKQNLIKIRTEDTIYYKYLNQQDSYPAGFPVNEGLVEWKGYIESNQTGLFKMLIYSSGYLKVWINNELITDSWRQSWNPWYRKFKVNMQKGEKLPVHVEWIPDGTESYLSLECLTPYNESLQNKLSLYSEAGKSIDYYFIKGDNPDDVVSGYREVTGKCPIMPDWAMGLWQSRERYKTQKELLDVVREYRKRKIPLDNIVLDWHYWEEDKWGDQSFDYKRFPDPKEMTDILHKKLNAHIMISVWAKYYENSENYKIMKDRGFLYMENIKNRQKDWVGPGYVSTFYDSFNPEARKEFWSQLRDSLYVKGFDAWWLDATEPDILSNTSIEARKKLMTPSIGPSTLYMNAFSLEQAKGVYEGQRAANPKDRVFILTRSAYAGQQRYAAATWSGDVASRWSDLKDQIAAGVNFSISGIPYWTTDIGGFALENKYRNPNKKDLKEWRELNLRWFQFGTFCPIFRIHGQYPYREIYNVSPEGHPVYNSMVYYDKLRYRLMPYIYSLAGMTWHNDFTIMRPLVMDFGKDRNVLSINDQFMFGKSMMVCPVTMYEARDRQVYFPSGQNWYDLLNGQYYTGGSMESVSAPLEKIPVFVPEGTILPVGPEIQYVSEKKPNPLEIYIFKGKDGHFLLYEDEGTNYDYENGSFSEIEFSWSDENNKLTLGKRGGNFPGMLKERTFIVKIISPKTGKGIDNKDIKSKVIDYSGEEIVVELQSLN